MSGWDVLERHFGDLGAAEVDTVLADLLREGAAPAAASAADFLLEHGGPELDGDPSPGTLQQRRTLTAAETLARTMHSTYSIDEAATRLGISRSRVSHRIADGTLWSIRVAGRRLVPRWQFLPGGGTLPGLAELIPSIPATLHPLAVERLMTTAIPEFDDLPPTDWLAGGGAAEVVAELLLAFGRG